jgi:hypothetical protein
MECEKLGKGRILIAGLYWIGNHNTFTAELRAT